MLEILSPLFVDKRDLFIIVFRFVHKSEKIYLSFYFSKSFKIIYTSINKTLKFT